MTESEQSQEDACRIAASSDEMTPWGKTKKELYDEAMERFEEAKAAGLHPDPFLWLTRGRSINKAPRSENG
jgi:hypothetical protein